MEKLKQIPKWARRYTESRTIPMIVRLLVVLALAAAVFFGVYCFLHGWVVLAAIMVGLYVVGFIYFVITCDRYEARYFTKTGIPQSESVKQIRKYMPLPLIAFVIISVVLEQRGVFPHHLSVPISAVYLCPLLIFANWRWAHGSFIGYLWAGLYGAWAIGILIGVPLLTFQGLWAGREVLVAIIVTGLITGLVAHIYSRYALKKLKQVAHLEKETANGD